MAMLVKDSVVQSNSESAADIDMSKNLERNWIFFSFQNGVVENVCPSAEDAPWVANVKKGILSAFQLSTTDIIHARTILERDVHGDCETRYELHEGWTTLRIRKTKYLDTCQNRVNVLSAVHGTPYTVAGMKGSRRDSFLNSSVECYHTVWDGLIQKVECAETHVVKQLSHEGNGARAEVTQSLTLVNWVPDNMDPGPPNEDHISSNLLFSHDYHLAGSDGGNRNLYKAETAIRQLCRSQEESAAHLFWQLVSAIKALPLQMLVELYDKVDTVCDFHPRGRQYFRDALPMAATGAALQLLTNLTLQGVFTNTEIDGWPIVLGLLAHPTKEAIAALVPLLDVDTLFSRISLAISSMIYNLCRELDIKENCLLLKTTSAFIGRMTSVATKYCSAIATSKDKHRVMIALKALANIGVVADDDLKNVVACANNARNPYEVRVVAVEVFRRMDCNVSRRSLWDIFSDPDEDSELRIAVYLQLMNCPNAEIIRDIHRVLLANDSVQVGGFVMSHMSSIRQSSIPSKEAIRKLFLDESLDEDYPTDFRKYSRYVGRSIFSETLDFGGNVEGSVVYSSSSYVPRSVNLNVTTDVFGGSYNLFEVRARLEGFDHLLESVFRPEDILTQGERFQSVAPKPPFQKLQAITEKLRSKRKLHPPPQASWSMRIYGSELLYESRDSAAINSAIYWWSELSLADLLYELAQNWEVDKSRAFVLIDSSLTVPTSLGFPMTLAINSTLNVHMKINGRFDLRHLHEGNCDVHGLVRPSASLSLSSALTVDSYCDRAGVSLEINANALLLADGALRIKNGSHLDVRLNVPQNSISIAEMRSTLSLLSGVKTVPIEGIAQGRVDTSRCFSPSQTFGMELCVALAFANATWKGDGAPHFPLTGPTRIALYAIKTDPSLTEYHLQYTLEKLHDERQSSWGIPRILLLRFDTPKSVVDREWTVDYMFSDANNNISLKVLTPHKKMAIFGAYSTDPNWKYLRFNFVLDGAEVLDFRASMKIECSEGYTRYSPKLVATTSPGITLIQMSGHVHVQPGRQLEVKLSIENLTVKPVILNGSITKNEKANNVEYEVDFSSPALNGNLDGFISTLNGSLASKTAIVYQITGSPKETLNVAAKFRYLLPSGGSLTKFIVTADVSFSVFPSINSIVTWEFARVKGHLENTFTLQRSGRDFDVFTRQMLMYEGTLEEHVVKGNLKLLLPFKVVNFSLDLDHESKLDHLKSKFSFRPTSQQTYAVEAEVENTSDERLAIGGRFALTLGDERNQVTGLIREERPKHFHSRFTHEDPSGVRRTASVEYKHHYSDTWANHSMQLDVPSWPLESTAILSAYEHGGNLKVESTAAGLRYSSDVVYEAPPKTPGVHKFQVAWRKPSITYTGRATLRNTREKTLDLVFARRAGTSSEETTKAGTVNRRIMASGRLKYTKLVRELFMTVEWDPKSKLNFTMGQLNKPNVKSTYTNGDYMDGEAGFKIEHTRKGSMENDRFLYMATAGGHWARSTKKASLVVTLSSLDIGDVGESHMIKGAVKVVTPVPGLENMGLAVERMVGKWLWNSSASASWKSKSSARFQSSGRSWSALHDEGNEAQFQVDTPFEVLEKAVVAWNRSRTGPESKVFVFASWSPLDNITAYASLIKPSVEHPSYSANVNLQTPFTVLHQVAASAEGRLTDQKLDAKLDALCECDGNLSLSARLFGEMVQLGATGKRLKAAFEVSSESNKGVATSAVLYHETDDLGRFASNVSVSWPTAKQIACAVNGIRTKDSEITLAISALLKTSSDRVDLVGSFAKVKSKVTANFHANRNRSKDEHTELWPDLRQGEFLLDSMVVSVGHLNISSGIKFMRTDGEWHETSLTVQNIRNASGLVSNFRILHIDQPAGIEILWQVGNRSLNALVLVEAPLQELSRASLSLTHVSHGDTIYKTLAKCDWGRRGHTISVNHTLSMTDRYNFNTSLDITKAHDEGLQIDVVQRWIRGFFHNYVKCQRGPHDELLVSDAQGEFASNGTTRTIDAKWVVSAPLWMNGHLQATANHSDNELKFSPTISICRYHHDTHCATASVNLKKPRVNDEGAAEANLLIETPNEILNNITVWALYSVPGIRMDVTTGVRWSHTGELSMAAGLRFHPTAPLAEIRLATPFAGFRSLKLRGGFDVETVQKTISGFVEQDGWQASISGWGKFDRDSAGIQLAVNTPDENIGEISIDGRYQWTNNLRDNQLVTMQMTWSKELMVEFQAVVVQPYQGRTVLNLTIVTPLDGLRRINASVDTIVTVDSKGATCLISWHPDHNARAFLQISGNDSVPLNLKATLQPTNASLDVTLARSRSDTSFELFARQDAREVSFEAKSHSGISGTDLSTTVRNTFPQVEIPIVNVNVHLARNHGVNATFSTGPFSSFLTGSYYPGRKWALDVIEMPSRRRIGSVVVKVDDSRGIDVTLDMQTVLPSLAKVSWRGFWIRKDPKANVGGMSLDVNDVQHLVKLELDDGEYRCNIKSPELGTDPWETSFLVRGEDHLGVLRFELTGPEDNAIAHKIILKVNVVSNSITCEAHLDAPILGFPYLNWTSNAIKRSGGIEGSATLMTQGGERYIASSEYNLYEVEGGGAVRVRASTPYEYAKSMWLFVERHGRQWDNSKINADIWLPVPGYEKIIVDARTEHTPGQFLVSLKAETPIPGYEKVGMLGNLSYNLELTYLEPLLNISLADSFVLLGIMVKKLDNKIGGHVIVSWQPGNTSQTPVEGVLRLWCEPSQGSNNSSACQGTVRFGGKDWRGNVVVDWIGLGNISVNVTSGTPYVKCKTFRANLAHLMGLAVQGKSVNNSLSCGCDETPWFTGNTTLILSPKLFHANLSLISAWEQFPRFLLFVDRDKKDNGQVAKAKVSLRGAYYLESTAEVSKGNSTNGATDELAFLLHLEEWFGSSLRMARTVNSTNVQASYGRGKEAVLLQAELKRLQATERMITIDISHTEHRGRLEAVFQRENRGHYNLNATLLWSKASHEELYPVMTCTASLNESQARLQWLQPNRTVVLVLFKPHRKHMLKGRTEAELELLWNTGTDDTKSLGVLLSHLNLTDDSGLNHVAAIEIFHPLLERTWHLESSICTQRIGRNLVTINTSLTYSPRSQENVQIMFQVDEANLFDTKGWALKALAVHVPSDLNYTMTALMGRGNGGMTFNAIFSSHELEYVWNSKLVKQHPQAFFEVYGPEFWYTLSANISRRSDGDIETVAICKSSNNIIADVYGKVEVNRRFATANITYATDWSAKRFEQVITRVGWKDERELIAQATMLRDGKWQWPLFAFIRLNSSRLFSARAYWEPTLHLKVKECLVENFGKLGSIVNDNLYGLASSPILLEAHDSLCRLGNAAWRPLEPVVTQLTELIEFIKEDWQHVLHTISDMRFFSYFHLDSLMETLEGLGEILREHAVWIWETVIATSDNGMRWILNGLRRLPEEIWLRIVDVILVNPIAMVKTTLNTLMTVIMDNLTSLWEHVSRSFTALSSFVDKIYLKISTLGKDIALQLAEMPQPFTHVKALLRNILDVLKEVAAKIEEFAANVKNEVTTGKLYSSLRSSYRYIVDGLSWAMDYCYRLIADVRVFLFNQLSEPQKQIIETLNQYWNDASQFFHSLRLPWNMSFNSSNDWTQVKQKILWMLDYHQLRPLNLWTLFGLYRRIAQPFQESLETSEAHFNSPNMVEVDTDEGVIVMDNHLPLPWGSLRSLPRVRDIPELSPIFDLWSWLSTTDRHTLSSPSPYLVEWEQKIYRIFDYAHWIPPFQAEAQLVAWKHVVTFDGRTLVLPNSQCTFLLAADMIDRNFSIAVTVGSEKQRSLVVFLDGKLVWIMPSEQVFVDQRKVELPTTWSRSVIYRQGSNVILRQGYGLQISCNMKYAVCSVRISGWYFGKTVGLFGVYDHEPRSDAVSVSKRYFEDWELSGDAGCFDATAFQVTSPRILAQPRERICWNNLVNLSSIMVNCYKTINPRPYYEMCVNEADFVCSAEAAYMYRCHSHNILLRMPRNCVSCQLPSGEVLPEGGNITVDPEGKKHDKTADIVFIVEAKTCNRNFTRIFAEFVNVIDNTLNSTGISKNRYAIVVFGGPGIHDAPHVHTWDSATFGRARSVPSLASFKVGRGSKDVFSALHFAANLAFRPGAAKTFLLITCSECDNREMRTAYPEIHRMILEDGITVHNLVYKELSIKNPENFYGVDGTLAYTYKHSRRAVLHGDADLRRQAILPKDICVPIALESNGTIFSNIQLLGANKRLAKSVMDVFSRRLALTASQDVCQHCDCLPDDHGIGQMYCQPCVFPRPANIYGVDDSLFDEYPSLRELELEYFGESQNFAENLVSYQRRNI